MAKVRTRRVLEVKGRGVEAADALRTYLAEYHDQLQIISYDYSRLNDMSAFTLEEVDDVRI
jgi:hypothetical protein